MFGKRGNEDAGRGNGIGQVIAPAPALAPAMPKPEKIETLEPVIARQQVSPPPLQTHSHAPQRKKMARTEEYYKTKGQVFSALIDTIDLS